jgi:serine phosphatase RsbU (regulator of sigma subunit)
MPRIQFPRALPRPRRPQPTHTAHLAPGAAAVDSPETVALRAEVARLQEAVDDLTVLLDLTREISIASGVDAVMQTIVKRCARAAHAEQALITPVDRQAGGLGHTLVRALDASGERPRFHLMGAIEGWMQHHKEPLLSNDPRGDPRLRTLLGAPCEDCRSLLCLPMLHHGELTAILTVCNSRRLGGFTAADQRLLSIVAGQSAQLVEEARRQDDAQRLQRLDEQLRMAREIQVALLPRVAPDVPGYDVAGVSVPAETMGGDYYDFFRLDPNRWALWLGDVSGKGLPASLLMANLQGALRGQIASDRRLNRSMRLAGRVLYHNTDMDKFATVFCCILDTRDHTLTYCNAGHEPPFHLGREPQPGRLAVGGTVLGAFEDCAYRQETVPVAADDVLVAYSDGVVDAEDPLGRPFTDARLAQVLTAHREQSARVIADAVVRAVAAHVSGAPPQDDITIMVVKRRA